MLSLLRREENLRYKPALVQRLAGDDGERGICGLQVACLEIPERNLLILRGIGTQIRQKQGVLQDWNRGSDDTGSNPANVVSSGTYLNRSINLPTIAYTNTVTRNANH